MRNTLFGSATLLALAIVGMPTLVPLLEREGIFQPRPYDPARPWTAPALSEELRIDVDGLQLHGWAMRSSRRPAKGAILYFHGNTGAIPDYLPTVERLRESGYDVLLWDYRGYGQSGGTADDEAALYRDSEAALLAFSQLLGIPPSRLILYGYSLGTAAATEMAIHHGCRALILQAPIATLQSHIAAHAPWLPDFPYAYLRNRLATASKIADIGCPLLVIHGEADEGILLSQGKAVFEAAREPKRFHLVPRGGHVLDARHGWQHVEQTLRFLDEDVQRRE